MWFSNAKWSPWKDNGILTKGVKSMGSVSDHVVLVFDYPFVLLSLIQHDSCCMVAIIAITKVDNPSFSVLDKTLLRCY